MVDGAALGGYPFAPAGAQHTVVHAGGVCSTSEPPEPLEGLPYGARRVIGGAIVSCPSCLQPGIEPDAGRLREFLPAGEATHDPVNGTVTWVYRV
jgi:hypothetical protein